MMQLPTNFQDADYDGLRKYRMITNDDGTVSFQDVTDYKRLGSCFGAEQINAINANINELVKIDTQSTEGTKYIKLATLKIQNTYQNSPITMELSRRGFSLTSKLFIKFENVKNKDPELSSFCYTYSDYEACLNKEAASTWGLYFPYPRYEQITVISYNIPYQSRNIKISWDKELVDSIPDGAIQNIRAEY